MREHKVSTARSAASSTHSATDSQQAQDDKRKPYLDKLVMKMNVPVDVPGYNDFNSVNTFPNLEHCGIKTEFEPKTTPVTNPHGIITPMYKVDAYETLRPIYRDHFELSGREEVFKKSHRQFIDDVLNDMEGTRVDQLERKLKHWTTKKNQLGFKESFNQSLGKNPAAASSSYSIDPDHSVDPNNVDAFNKTQESNQLGNTRSTVTTRGSIKEGTGGINEHGKIVNKNGHRPPNKIALFKVLLETVPAPRSPRKRYGTVGEHRMNQSLSRTNQTTK